MFRPELKNTGWGYVDDIVFELTGENYKESKMLDRTFYDFEKSDGNIVTLSKCNPIFTILEKELATLINNSLMSMIWDSITISKMEACFKNAISEWGDKDNQLRLELPGDYSYEINNSNCIYGWVHYKDSKKINTFRFQIGLDGSFKKC